MDEQPKTEPCCADGACETMPRRQFLALSGLTLLNSALPNVVPDAKAPDHYIPADKHLTPNRKKALFARGQRKIFRGDELRTIGMPCGGVAAGQLYVRGDGTLAYWWIGNNAHHSSYGGQTSIDTPLGKYGVCYGTYTPPSPIHQRFVIATKSPDSAKAHVRELSSKGFDSIGFIGEYPVATVLYKDTRAFPVEVSLDVFSPFIPLNARDSAMPTTILRYSVKNTSATHQEVMLSGELQNPVMQELRETMPALSRNRVVDNQGRTSLVMDVLGLPHKGAPAPIVEMFEDFENGYGKWKIEGDAFGTEPPTGTLSGQQSVTGFTGKHLVNTFRNGDTSTGKATSQPFVIHQPYIAFLIGGGQDVEHTALWLVVDGQVVRRAAGKENEMLVWASWHVSEFVGKEAHLEIVDSATGPWGHINVDNIIFTNVPPKGSNTVFSDDHPQFGNVALTAFAPDSTATAHVPDTALTGDARSLTGNPGEHEKGPRLVYVESAEVPLHKALVGSVTSRKTLKPGETYVFTFVLSWYFPNRRQFEGEGNSPGGSVGATGPLVGQMYANWFGSALDVAHYVADNLGRLTGETFAFRDTYYDTTLPYWMAQRISMPLANMATEVFQWWKNGRVWAWEGVGCCTGCCGHVYNYAQAMARLFPEMERTIRTMQDFNPNHGFVEATGAIGFRGMPGGFWAGDAQGGYILKAYREHLCSTNDSFLRQTWPHIRKALEFLLKEDGNDDGLIEGAQHNTYDIWFFGPNTMVGSLYLGALRAGARMARLMGDTAFATRCEKVADIGAKETMRRLWNGEYFIQAVDLKEHPKDQYATGCLSDQLLGQWFADQLDLGYLYPKEAVHSAIASVFKYNWAPDVGPQNRAHHPDRTFCAPGEAGLLTCTWPHSKHMGASSVLYRDEVWTGIEYQVAAQLMYEGLTTESLAILRGIHDRYDGVHHNPWNEIECGDHYARSMASWSLLLAASGFEHDGPAGRIGFAPALTPDDFRCFFSASEGWGTFAQKRQGDTLLTSIHVKWGRLRLRELTLKSEPRFLSNITLNGKPVSLTQIVFEPHSIVVTFAHENTISKGQTLEIKQKPGHGHRSHATEE